jgi:hypothetical protein
MSFYKAFNITYFYLIRYLQYAQIGARTLRSVLKEDSKAIALKREEIALRKAVWQNGKIGDSKFIAETQKPE